MLVAGIALLVNGHLSALPSALGSLAIPAVVAGINVAGIRSLERDIPKLVQEMNGVLDSTATFTGTAP